MFLQSPFWASISRLAVVALVAVGVMAALRSASADTVLLTGVIESINGTQITIGDRVVEMGRADDHALQAGQRFEGEIQQVGGKWVVQRIITLDVVNPFSNPSTNPPSSSVGSSASYPRLDDAMIMVIEGPIEAINNNIITIHSTNIEVNLNDLKITQWQVGSSLRIEELWCEGACASNASAQIVAITVVLLS
jgi:hypothetical protein